MGLVFPIPCRSLRPRDPSVSGVDGAVEAPPALSTRHSECAADERLEGARLVHAMCLESMPEEQAFVAAIASLGLLVPHYDVETINVARAVFAEERMASRLAALDTD